MSIFEQEVPCLDKTTKSLKLHGRFDSINFVLTYLAEGLY